MSQLFNLSPRQQHRLFREWGWEDAGPAQGGHFKMRHQSGATVAITHPDRGGKAKGHAISVRKAARVMGLTTNEFLAGRPEAKVNSTVRPEAVFIEVPFKKIPDPEPVVEVPAAPEPKEQQHMTDTITTENRRGHHMRGPDAIKPDFTEKGISKAVTDLLAGNPGKKFTLDQITSRLPFTKSQISAHIATKARSPYNGIVRTAKSTYTWNPDFVKPKIVRRGTKAWQAQQAPQAEQVELPSAPNVPDRPPVVVVDAVPVRPEPVEMNGTAPALYEKTADLGGNVYVLRGDDGLTYVARLARVVG